MTSLRASSPVNDPSRAAAPVVAAQGLSKVFKDFWRRDRARAVDNISFDIRPREVFGLLGPNGSGKSTTIKMILGLLRPSAGRLAVLGKPPTDVETKRRIGYLPEESYLYPFLNARETLEYYAKLFELDHRTRQRRIDELLDMVGLTSAQHRPVREYSKGMQRRIGLAQALINDPDFLILDEPTTGLDPIGTRQVKDLIIALGKRGKTVLLSSHLLADVEDCVDRLVILYGGRIRAEGTCDDLLEMQDRTTIEADSLDEATLAEVDTFIRQRTGGAKSVRRVSRPRQKLEELFVGLVEQARAERLETSGAQHGGQTASFLQGPNAPDAPSEGQHVVDRLVRAADDHVPPPKVESRGTPTHQPVPEPSPDVIDALLGKEPPQQPAPSINTRQAKASTPSAPAKPLDTAEVDRSVIDALLGGGQGPGAGDRERNR